MEDGDVVQAGLASAGPGSTEALHSFDCSLLSIKARVHLRPSSLQTRTLILSLQLENLSLREVKATSPRRPR